MESRRLLVGTACMLLFLTLTTTPVMGSVWDVGISCQGAYWKNYWNGYNWVTPTLYYPTYSTYYPYYRYRSGYAYDIGYGYNTGCTAQSCTNIVVVKQEKQTEPTYSKSSTQSPTSTRCGDGWCSGSETQYSCPADCRPLSYCGDGVCNNGETESSCYYDCAPKQPAPYCGDGICNGGETKYSCQTDCGQPPYCGDGVCNGAETKQTCPEDCGLAPYCGDGNCDRDESRYNCAKDCGLPPYCGDGKCDPDESPYTCSLDCGEPKCTNPSGEEGEETCRDRQKLVCRDGNWQFEQSVQCCGDGDCPSGYKCSGNRCELRTYCGDGRCLDAENPYNCPVDCAAILPAPPVPCRQPSCQLQSYCGDGVCNGDETCQSCPGDCGSCARCGDGVCNLQTENQQTCPEDCGEQARHFIELGVLDECHEIVQGGNGSFTLIASNKGNVPETLTLEVGGDMAPWIHQPGSVTIAPNAVETWKLEIRVPESMAPGLYDIPVTARNGNVQDSTILHVDVRLPAPETPLEMVGEAENRTEEAGGNRTIAAPTGAIVIGDVLIPDWILILGILALITLLFIFLLSSRSTGESAAHKRLGVISHKVKEPILTPDGGSGSEIRKW